MQNMIPSNDVLCSGQFAGWPSWGLSNSIHCYDKVRQIGQGTYGKVYEGRERKTGQTVALKKIKFNQEKRKAGVPNQTIREIRILRAHKHDNLVNLFEVVTSNREGDRFCDSGSIYLVFEYASMDLTGLVDLNYQFTEPEVKCFTRQLLQAMSFLHGHSVCHRDIKSSNILITVDHRLKVADFGLARILNRGMVLGEQPKYTNKVITLWYRPPELLLGERNYGCKVDMWSIGCILGELLTRGPIIQGKSEIDQLKKIFELCGLPSDRDWTKINALPRSHLMQKFTFPGSTTEEGRLQMKPPPGRLQRFFNDASPIFSPKAVDLCIRLLTMDPILRWTADQALESDYIVDAPACEALEPIRLPSKIKSLHEWETKKRKKTSKDVEARKLNGGEEDALSAWNLGEPVPGSGLNKQVSNFSGNFQGRESYSDQIRTNSNFTRTEKELEISARLYDKSKKSNDDKQSSTRSSRNYGFDLPNTSSYRKPAYSRKNSREHSRHHDGERRVNDNFVAERTTDHDNQRRKSQSLERHRGSEGRKLSRKRNSDQKSYSFEIDRKERSLSPVSRRRSRSPISRRRSRSPISRRRSRSPDSRRRSRSPVSRRHSRSPVSRRHSRSPVSRRHSRSPVSRHHSRSPIDSHDSGSPGRRRLNRSSSRGLYSLHCIHRKRSRSPSYRDWSHSADAETQSRNRNDLKRSRSPHRRRRSRSPKNGYRSRGSKHSWRSPTSIGKRRSPSPLC